MPYGTANNAGYSLFRGLEWLRIACGALKDVISMVYIPYIRMTSGNLLKVKHTHKPRIDRTPG